MQKSLNIKGIILTYLVLGIIFINLLYFIVKSIDFGNYIIVIVSVLIYIIIIWITIYYNTYLILFDNEKLEILNLYRNNNTIISIKDISDINDNFILSKSPFCKKIKIKYFLDKKEVEIFIVLDKKEINNILVKQFRRI